MSENKGASGTTELPSGNDQKSVSYETHQRLLAQRKKDQERFQDLETKLSDFETQKKTDVEKKLEEDGELRKVLELRDQEINGLKEKLGSVESERDQIGSRLVDDMKERAFLSKLPGKIKKEEYLSFVDLKSIALVDGKVDSQSVDQSVNGFMESYSDLVDTGTFKGLPSDAPSSGKKLTREEWLKLPLKEKKTNLKYVLPS